MSNQDYNDDTITHSRRIINLLGVYLGPVPSGLTRVVVGETKLYIPKLIEHSGLYTCGQQSVYEYVTAGMTLYLEVMFLYEYPTISRGPRWEVVGVSRTLPEPESSTAVTRLPVARLAPHKTADTVVTASAFCAAGTAAATQVIDIPAVVVAVLWAASTFAWALSPYIARIWRQP